MAAFFSAWSMLLWTRSKGAQSRAAEGKEPRGIENRDHHHRHKALA